MGLKSDGWIRRMALEQGMIEPFVDGQVREGVISYGLSSYGYDIRVTDEFKIFTNVHSAMVDPKHFNPNSFVDFKGDVCVIPPNSFVLSRTVEYFRIPRDVLTICIGKCLTSDTRVVDAETGAYLPIAEAAAVRQTVGLQQWEVGTVPVSDFIPNGKRVVYELTTNMGLKIRATANHPFRQLHGWTPLADLRPGDRIAVARRIPVFGKQPLPDWEAILLGLMISEGQCHTPGHSPLFTNEDPELVHLLEQCVHEGLEGKVTFNGKIGYRLVNHQGRGGRAEKNRAALWLKQYNLNVGSSDKFVPQAIFMSPKETVRLFLQALFSGDGSIWSAGEFICLEYYSNSRRLIEDVHHLLLRFGIVSFIREKQTDVGTTAYRLQITDREQISRFADQIGFWPRSKKQIRMEEVIGPLLLERSRRQKSNFDTLPKESWDLLKQATRQAGVSLRQIGVQRTNPAQSLSYAIAAPVAAATGHEELAGLVNGPIWDTVVKIECVGEAEVYDLTVPGAHNFVANDIIAHNSTYARCGLIVNVTPFEPEWEGYVTLEISNTTPLPAKVYAHEGIAQVVFFQGDEVCQVSYADRKGKYQSQQTIVLPRI
jgi:deoxycytidine triphosphate deaminase